MIAQIAEVSFTNIYKQVEVLEDLFIFNILMRKFNNAAHIIFNNN